MADWEAPGYTKLKELGSGGFGAVVLARHDASGTLVAIKYLRRNLLADAEFAELFHGEASVLASLDDPNVVRLYEYLESPSGAAIVMELVDGVSLREILTHQGATTAEAALVVLQGSLLGLAAAHQRGVVHRDYKPENVLVNGEGASKLTDFGIAARAGDSPRPAGTLIYAPPEQFAGRPASPARRSPRRPPAARRPARSRQPDGRRGPWPARRPPAAAAARAPAPAVPARTGAGRAAARRCPR